MSTRAFNRMVVAVMVAAGSSAPASAQRSQPGAEQREAPAATAPAQAWRPAPANLAPFHVAIAFSDATPGQLPSHRCVGVALSRNWILVSALCVGGGGEDQEDSLVEPNEIRVHAGPRIQARSSGAAVNQIVRHPQYNDRTRANDLALIRTSAALPAAVTPISLAQRGAALPETGVVVGWQDSEDGARRTLVSLSAPFVARTACQQAIRTQRLEEGRQQFDGLTESLGVPAEAATAAWAGLEAATRVELPEGIACASPREGYPCDNDPGASLIQVQGTAVTLLGLSMRTEACEVAGVPNQFTLVEPHLDWIRSTTGQ